ncbi:MAG: recombinase RecA [Thermoprotei archaeon]|nr:MAG: recombinase RecA [Thermoprotei archaeon]RLE98475.1 MAG: recombinase RecA [Thermoprotei archaeon]
MRGLEIIPSGIEGLDQVIGGGFIRGRTYLVSGETGTGKTLFSLNFLVYGITLGDKGVYVLVDESVEDLMRGAKDFGWDLEALVDRGFLSILTLSQEAMEKLSTKPLDTIVRSIVVDIKSEVEKIGASRLVIDPVISLVFQEKDVVWMREFIRRLIMSIENEVKCTTIITSEIPTNSNSISRFGVEEFLASGVLVLGLQRIGDEYIRTLLVRKMRWRPVKPSIYVFEIVPGKGIVVKGRLREYIKTLPIPIA